MIGRLVLFLYLLFWVGSFFPMRAHAFDLSGFEHTPPNFTLDQGAGQHITLHIAETGLRRARVLVATSEGYRAYEMRRVSDKFETDIKFEDLALLQYHFQLQDLQGQVYESDSYTIRQPSNHELERVIVALEGESLEVKARVRQLENVLFSVKKADPEQLARRKNQEMARAMIALSKHERESKEARSEVERKHKGVLERLRQTPQGKQVESARQFIYQDGQRYWQRYADGE